MVWSVPANNQSSSVGTTVMTMVLTIGVLPCRRNRWRLGPELTPSAGARRSGSACRAGPDETLETVPGLQHRWLHASVPGDLPALVENRPDDVGHKVGRDPPLQLGGQGRGHGDGQLLAVVRHRAHRG